MVPRSLSAREWAKLSKGIEQRVGAINAFLHDIYNRQEILRAGIVPTRLVAQNEAFLPEMMDFTPPGGVNTHIVGTDIERTGEADFFVLEDNARTPSGVSSWLAHGVRVGIISFHSLEDRAVKQAFAGLRERGHAELVTRKPVEAGASEVQDNPRSRSAKLRVVRVV